MDRVDEIAAALKLGITPMFLYGMVALAKQDFEGVMSDLREAEKRVVEEMEGRHERI